MGLTVEQTLPDTSNRPQERRARCCRTKVSDERRRRRKPDLAAFPPVLRKLYAGNSRRRVRPIRAAWR